MNARGDTGKKEKQAWKLEGGSRGDAARQRKNPSVCGGTADPGRPLARRRDARSHAHHGGPGGRDARQVPQAAPQAAGGNVEEEQRRPGKTGGGVSARQCVWLKVTRDDQRGLSCVSCVGVYVSA